MKTTAYRLAKAVGDYVESAWATDAVYALLKMMGNTEAFRGKVLFTSTDHGCYTETILLDKGCYLILRAGTLAKSGVGQHGTG